ncbi:hypothetical protein IHN63_00680 [Deinococcus sp. 6YEL10]|uniref:hypothetical protein n=1 Tax=Deinococcus sp. 6YEL10 TaxID=2745870 RepID=UPI001E552EF5|nr:hypothetical protein [Deinococcus sp. 6YEL10]MCD0159813.1 hypothetical protein [Deinococcus sp. 6YEL10]
MKGKHFLALFGPVLVFALLVLLLQLAGPFLGFQSSQGNTELVALIIVTVLIFVAATLVIRYWINRKARA